LLARQTATIDALSADGSAWVWESGCAMNDYLRPGSSFAGGAAGVDEQLPTCAACGLRSVIEGVGPLSAIGATGGRPSAHWRLRAGGARRIAAWGDGYMAPGGGEPESMLELWRQPSSLERNGRQDNRVGSVLLFCLGPKRLTRRPFINANYGYIRSSRRGACAAFQPRLRPSRSDQAPATWALTNQSCGLARKTWTR